MKPSLLKSKPYQALSINDKINIKAELKRKKQFKISHRLSRGLIFGFTALALGLLFENHLNPDCKD